MLKKVIVDGVKSLFGEFDIEQYTMLQGDNGTNKSALLEAIVLCWSGSHPILGSRPSDYVVIMNKDSMSIELIFDINEEEFRVKREYVVEDGKVSQTVYINDKKKNVQEAAVIIENTIGRFKYSFDVSGFVHEKEKAKVLFNFLGDKGGYSVHQVKKNMIDQYLDSIEAIRVIIKFKYKVESVQKIPEKEKVKFLTEEVRNILTEGSIQYKTFTMLLHTKGDVLEYINKVKELVTQYISEQQEFYNIKKKTYKSMRLDAPDIEIEKVENNLAESKKQLEKHRLMIDRWKDAKQKSDSNEMQRDRWIRSLGKELTTEEIFVLEGEITKHSENISTITGTILETHDELTSMKRTDHAGETPEGECRTCGSPLYASEQALLRKMETLGKEMDSYYRGIQAIEKNLESNKNTITRNDAIRKEIDDIPKIKVPLFDEVIIDLAEALEKDVNTYGEQKKEYLGYIQNEERLQKMIEEAEVHQDAAKYLRTYQKLVTGQTKQIVSGVLGLIQAMTDKIMKGTFPYDECIIDQDRCGVMCANRFYDLRGGLSAGEGGVMGMAILIATMSLMDIPQKVITMESAEIDKHNTTKFLTNLQKIKCPIDNVIMASIVQTGPIKGVKIHKFQRS